MEQSVESNSFEIFKEVASLALPTLFVHISYFLKKIFSENPTNPDMGIFLLE